MFRTRDINVTSYYKLYYNLAAISNVKTMFKLNENSSAKWYDVLWTVYE